MSHQLPRGSHAGGADDEQRPVLPIAAGYAQRLHSLAKTPAEAREQGKLIACCKQKHGYKLDSSH